MKANKRNIQLWLIDSVIFAAACGAAACLPEMDKNAVLLHGDVTITACLALYACIMSARFLAKLYRNIWRYANVLVYLRQILADGIGGVLYLGLGRITQTVNAGETYAMITGLIVILLTLISRFFYQAVYALQNQGRGVVWKKRFDTICRINVAIVGAGNVGAALAEELRRNPKSQYCPYCFIDNDANKIGNKINGLWVYPEDDSIIQRIKSLPVQEMVIALPDASAEEKARLYKLYQQTACKVKLYDYFPRNVDAKPGEKPFWDFCIEDLLFRKSVSINSQITRTYYAGKTVLVTGGGGSIGAELCRQLTALNLKKLVILDIYENNAYDIQQELSRTYGQEPEVDVVIASVRDVERMDEIFRAVRPNVVFHAAAHKHVPLMENSACEAIKNNVMGTYNIADMAEKYGVQKFLLVSTDKAVNPTSVMGASKRLCEMVVQCRTDSSCEFTAVRFGNVLGSGGSVIPLFQKQIELGGPLTVTDRRMIRYFMTIPEAVELVMETGAMARCGELFVLDMGKPVKILDLAETMITLSGLKPYQDIDIVEIGLRPGEKLYEELLMKTEELDKTSNEMIYIERDKPFRRTEVEDKIAVLMKAVAEGGYEAIVQAISETVPTYQTPGKGKQKAAAAERERKSMTKLAERCVEVC